MTRERRQYNRFPLELEASLDDLDQTLSVSLLNVSDGGIFVRCKRPPKRWGNVDVRIHVPKENRTIVATGVVVWTINEEDALADDSLEPGAGIQFTEIDPEDLRLLQSKILDHEEL